MVGHRPLEAVILVRIQVSQPNLSFLRAKRSNSKKLKLASELTNSRPGRKVSRTEKQDVDYNEQKN